MAEAKAEVIDASLAKVPFEALKRAAKERKALIDEVGEALSQLGPLPSCSTSEQLVGLDQIVEKLQGVKRKLADVSRQEKDEAQRCKARLEHISTLGSPGKEGAILWSKQRLDRILVDYLLRSGYHGTAELLAREAGCIQLVDLHIFQGAKHVIQSLRNHDCSGALSWCQENRARLKKIKSNFEFKLRLQEFLELVRKVRCCMCSVGEVWPREVD